MTYTRLDQSSAIGGADIHDTDLTSLTAALDRMLAVLREASESDTRAPVRVLAEFDARRVCVMPFGWPPEIHQDKCSERTGGTC